MEKSALNDQFQSTVSRMNTEINDLQKRLEELDTKLLISNNEGKMKEADMERRLDAERDQTRQRDMRIDQLMTELNSSRKQIEDLKMTVADMDKLRGELAQRFDDLRFDN